MRFPGRIEPGSTGGVFTGQPCCLANSGSSPALYLPGGAIFPGGAACCHLGVLAPFLPFAAFLVLAGAAGVVAGASGAVGAARGGVPGTAGGVAALGAAGGVAGATGAAGGAVSGVAGAPGSLLAVSAAARVAGPVNHKAC